MHLLLTYFQQDLYKQILDERTLRIYICAITPAVRSGRMTFVCAPLVISYLVFDHLSRFQLIKILTYRTYFSSHQPDDVDNTSHSSEVTTRLKMSFDWRPLANKYII